MATIFTSNSIQDDQILGTQRLAHRQLSTAALGGRLTAKMKKQGGVSDCDLALSVTDIECLDRQGFKKKSLNSTTFRRLSKKNLRFIEFNKVNISSSQLRKF